MVKWHVRSGYPEPVSSLAALEEALIADRGIEPYEEGFFRPRYQEVIHDPLALYGMDEAVARISFAIKEGQRIVVWGDYDADGVTSTAQLIIALRELGAQVTAYLPHRLHEGYGLSMATLEALAAQMDLLITVDCGVSAVEEIAGLAKKGIDVIVVDHHEFGEELPTAKAVLHPRHPQGHYPWGYLCGAGMAWKLVHALFKAFQVEEGREKLFLDLAALGTIADVVPLQRENRAIVQFGLQMLSISQRPGLKFMLNQLRMSGVPSVEDVAFRIIPRLNAPGRLDHAQPALDLLVEEDAGRAAELAASLDQYNKDRQKIVQKLLKEAQVQVDAESPFLLVSHQDWPAGVVGLLAGRLAAQYNRPVLAVGGNGRHAVGSARAPQGHNVLNLLRRAETLFLKLGGHAQAAGFSLNWDKLEEAREALLASFADNDTKVAEAPMLADAAVHAGLVSWEAAKALALFGPFGEGNRKPSLVFQRLPLLSCVPIGQHGKHAKFTFDIEGQAVDGIGFGLGELAPGLTEYVDVVGSPEISVYRGRSRLQLVVTGVEAHGQVTIVNDTVAEQVELVR